MTLEVAQTVCEVNAHEALKIARSARDIPSARKHQPDPFLLLREVRADLLFAVTAIEAFMNKVSSAYIHMNEYTPLWLLLLIQGSLVYTPGLYFNIH
jgi:hypothetical protein